MLISELAIATGASPRALRHYEEQGLLHPARDTAGYRRYVADDVVRVGQIRTMIAAGLDTRTIAKYLDCLRGEAHGATIELCPALRAELDTLARRLQAQQKLLSDKQQRLLTLMSSCPAPPGVACG